MPGVTATWAWPLTTLHGTRVGGVEPGDVGLDGERHGGHRQHPALRLEQPGDEVEAGDGVVVQLPEGDDEEVAERVPAQRAVTGEAVLEHVPPGLAPLALAAQRRQRHPQVAGRKHPELVPEPPGRAAVVGDRDDRGHLVGDVAQGREGRRQAMAAPQRRDDRPAHSRPRSRWTTKVATRSVVRRAATAWAIATERCLPPVQPIAIVA